jgi:hypothetical protein
LIGKSSGEVLSSWQQKRQLQIFEFAACRITVAGQVVTALLNT